MVQEFYLDIFSFRERFLHSKYLLPCKEIILKSFNIENFGHPKYLFILKEYILNI